jgi:hypothetical protein
MWDSGVQAMTSYGPGNGNGSQSQSEEWVLTLTNGLVTRIERVDGTTQARSELTANEYAALLGSYYTAYYAGIRDYVAAIASGNADVAQAYYQGLAQYLGALGQP